MIWNCFPFILSWIKITQFLLPCVLIEWFAHTHVLGKKSLGILKHSGTETAEAIFACLSVAASVEGDS